MKSTEMYTQGFSEKLNLALVFLLTVLCGFYYAGKYHTPLYIALLLLQLLAIKSS